MYGAGGEHRRLPANRLQRQVQERGAPCGVPERRASRLCRLLLPKAGRGHVHESASANQRRRRGAVQEHDNGGAGPAQQGQGPRR